uniref:Uncharacterized protein n=1 Tax=Arundo donax TaxID=35708 RepID=A0A0A9FWH7_ARUDO
MPFESIVLFFCRFLVQFLKCNFFLLSTLPLFVFICSQSILFR